MIDRFHQYLPPIHRKHAQQACFMTGHTMMVALPMYIQLQMPFSPEWRGSVIISKITE